MAESIVPSAGEYPATYKKSDVITLKFNPTESYFFKNWKVTPEDAATIADVTALETTVTILADNVVIEPVCGKRAQVVASTPVYETIGVHRNSTIRVLFDMKMSDHAIYWTEAELKEIKAEKEKDGATVSYSDYKVTGQKSENNKDYFYAYEEKTATKTNKYYKNIEIKIRNTETSLLNGNYFGCPYFEEDNSILVIPPRESIDIIPEFSDIEFTILKGFINKDGIEIARKYSNCYHTNGQVDFGAPKFSFYVPQANIKFAETYFTVDPYLTTDYITNLMGEVPYTGEQWSIGYSDTREIPGTEAENIKANRDNAIKTATSYEELVALGVKDTKTVTLDGYLKVEDEKSYIAQIVMTLTPIKNKLYPNQSSQVYKVANIYNDNKIVEFGEHDQFSKHFPKLSFDLSSVPTEGIYQLSISVLDEVGNSKEISIVSPIKVESFGWGRMELPVYCIVDNIFDTNFTYTATKDSNVSNRFNIVGSKGKYYYYEASNGDDYMIKPQYWRVETFKTANSDNVQEITSENTEIYFSKSDSNNTLSCQQGYLLIQDTFGNIDIRKLW